MEEVCEGFQAMVLMCAYLPLRDLRAQRRRSQSYWKIAHTSMQGIVYWVRIVSREDRAVQ